MGDAPDPGGDGRRQVLTAWQLRAAFAARLSAMYGAEVPAYLRLVEVTAAVNAGVLDEQGEDAERLGGAARVSAERHGAIRLGSARELAQARRLFAALGMHPVGYYDLRDSGVPVVSTAFRPVADEELERNPFRVFTSVLASDDARFFGADLAARVRRRVEERELFGPELLSLADRAAADGGLADEAAERFLGLLVDAFRLDRTPIDKAWHDELHAVSPVAADIAGCPSTHVNHLTPRVLDIDELHRRMAASGIEMIPEIQGPPAWGGPALLLRQTSFKALAETRSFRLPDGSTSDGQLRVRFGEVEARGIALTAAGRERYEHAMSSTSDADADARPQAFADTFPATERALLLQGLGVFRAIVDDRPRRDGRGPQPDLGRLVDDGFVTLSPVVYEDFLPRSAAGIFRSNLDGDGTTSASAAEETHGRAWLAGVLDTDLAEPDDLYAVATAASLREVERRLDLPPSSLG